MEDDPAYEIVVTRVSDDSPRCESRLREAIEFTLRRHGTRSAQINIALVDDTRIAGLNALHLEHEGPTDVLTFDLRDAAAGSREEGHGGGGAVRREDGNVEGEIGISVDTAVREAGARGHDIEAELALYAVHGTLHLLGYDDLREVDAAHMHTVEDQILAAVGCGAIYRTHA